MGSYSSTTLATHFVNLSPTCPLYLLKLAQRYMFPLIMWSSSSHISYQGTWKSCFLSVAGRILRMVTSTSSPSRQHVRRSSLVLSNSSKTTVSMACTSISAPCLHYYSLWFSEAILIMNILRIITRLLDTRHSWRNLEKPWMNTLARKVLITDFC